MASKHKTDSTVEAPVLEAMEFAAEPMPAPEATKPAPAEVKTAEDWAELVKPAAWLWPSARFLKGWAIGQEITRQEFEAAIEAVKHVQHR